MEYTSDIVAEGKLIGETSCQDRSGKYTELEIEGIKIDFYDTKNKVIHEVKKSDTLEEAHLAQVKYYLYIREKKGIHGCTTIIEFPKLRQRQVVEWENEDLKKVKVWISEANQIIHQPNCLPLIHKSICKKSSYFDFCYATENSEYELN